VVVCIVIAAVASAVGFFVFLQDAEVREKLQSLGSLAFFAAFSNGFGAASLAEEFGKK